MSGIIGLGTAAIGRPQYINLKAESSEVLDIEVFKQKGKIVLEEAYQQGVRYFDTAPGYGLAEQLVLDWVTEKADTSIEIASKWGYTYVANFDPNATVHEVKDHGLSKLKEQWVQPQKLLPYLTTYQIHSATFESGVLSNQAVLDYLFSLKKEFGIKIGLTTTGDNQVAVIQEARQVMRDNEPLFEVYQCTYNVFDQSIAALRDWIKDSKIRLVIKEALANGRVFPNQAYAQYASHYELLASLATKYEVGIDAIALRFCLDSIGAFAILSGVTKSSQLLENMKATHFTLEGEDIQKIRSVAISPVAYWQERKQLGWN